MHEASTNRFLPWIAAIAFFMQTLDVSILNTALPSIADSFGISALHVESAVVYYALSVALFIPVSGFLADKFGTRNTFISALFIFSLGSLLSSMSTSILELNISRAIQGIGGAMMVPVSRLALLKTFKREDFLNALNISTTLGLIGPFLGPILGGYLSEELSWHWIFLINIPVGVIGIFLSLKLMENKKEKNATIDIPGLILISLAFTLIVCAFEIIDEKSEIRTPALLFMTGVLFFGSYIKYAIKRKVKNIESIFPIDTFKIRTFKIGIVSNVLTRIGAQAIPFLIPLLLQLEMGYSAIESGLMLMPLAAAAIIMKILVTKILKKYGYKNVLTTTTIVVGISIITLSLIQKETEFFYIALILFIMGLFNSLRFTAMSSITLADLPQKKESSGNSMLAVSQQLGITIAIALSAVLVRVISGYPLLHVSLFDSFKITLVILGVITMLSSISFFFLKKEDGKNLTSK